MNSHRHLTHHLATVGMVAAISILVAACGGTKKPPAPSASGSPQGSGIKDAYRYADCMRSHGVSAFQDPHISSHGNSTSVGFHVDPQITGSPDFKSAQTACAHILPGLTGGGPTPAEQHAREQAMLAFAGCMRQHGFPKFPDPTAQGRLTLAMITNAGIELGQPAVKPAAYTCAPVTHGLLTRADIDQALANPTASGSQSSPSGG